MSREPEPSQEPEREESEEQAAVRRRRLRARWGSVLPEQTSDDVDHAAGSGGSDQWWRDQVPPHHG